MTEWLYLFEDNYDETSQSKKLVANCEDAAKVEEKLEKTPSKTAAADSRTSKLKMVTWCSVNRS